MLKELSVILITIKMPRFLREQRATVYAAHTQQINPLEKLVELYERLLKSEQEKIEILRECIKQGK